MHNKQNKYKFLKNLIMEFLGYIEEVPTKKNQRDWNYVEIQCPDEQNFTDVTSKLIKGMKDTCRFKVNDQDGKSYTLDVLDIRYDVTEYMVRLWPYDFKRYIKE